MASSKLCLNMYCLHSGFVISLYMASTKLLATKESAVEKKPRFLITIVLSSSVNPSLDFQSAMSAVMFTSCGIQWLALPSRYFCHAQSYLNGTSWLRSALQLIIALSSTWTLPDIPSSSSSPSFVSRTSIASFACFALSPAAAGTCSGIDSSCLSCA